MAPDIEPPGEKPICEWPELRFLPKEKGLEKVALASLPGSGNTWVRHLIQLATGFMTGSEFADQELKQSGFPGEGVKDKRVVAVKVHGPNE